MTTTNTNETPEQKAARIEAMTSTANYQTIISGFAARGIDVADIKPRENVFTFDAWIGKGRCVNKGEKSVRIDVWIPYTEKDKETGEESEKRSRRVVSVFHISQTRELSHDEREKLLKAKSERRGTRKGKRTTKTTGGAKRKPWRGVTAERLRELADNMQSKIDHKLNPPISKQNHTARRSRIAAGMRAEGRRLQDVQAARRKMADGIDAGTLPDYLRTCYSEKALLRLTDWDCTTFDADEKAASDWLKPSDHDEQTKARDDFDASDKLRRDILDNPPDGFFPTPAALAQRAVAAAGIKNGDEILEPSGGIGSLSEMIVSEMANRDIRATLDIVETNPRLCEYMRSIGFEPHCMDIHDVNGTCDVVVMNPPFEKHQDIDHVLHCLRLLKPGGRLVAIMSGSTERGGGVRKKFRDKLREDETIRSANMERIDNAFTGSESLRQTGVSVVLLTIVKHP